MPIKKITVAAVAALGLSIGASSASASPVNQGATAPAFSKAPSTFTLIAAHMGGGGGHMGGGMGGMHFGGGGMSHMGGAHFAGGGMRYSGPRIGGFHGYGRPTGFYNSGPARFHGGRTAFYHGHHGHWRHGHWYPFVGVGIYAGGSCYWNCRAAGYGPAYCSAYSYNFCY